MFLQPWNAYGFIFSRVFGQRILRRLWQPLKDLVPIKRIPSAMWTSVKLKAPPKTTGMVSWIFWHMSSSLWLVPPFSVHIHRYDFQLCTPTKGNLLDAVDAWCQLHRNQTVTRTKGGIVNRISVAIGLKLKLPQDLMIIAQITRDLLHIGSYPQMGDIRWYVCITFGVEMPLILLRHMSGCDF